MSALLPCPFCGGEARIDENISGDAWMVICPDEHCGVRSETAEWWSPQSAAIDRWNTRATPAEVAALRAHVAKQARIMAVLLAHASSAPLTDEDMQWARAQVAALEPTR